MKCPHYYEATDGVHVVIVGRCNCHGELPEGEGNSHAEGKPESICLSCTYGPKKCRRYKCGCYLPK
jgi:hypothetical protein